MAQKKPNWNFAPPDAEAGIGEGPENHAAWYRRGQHGKPHEGREVFQWVPAEGHKTWMWMGGRKDFPVGSELRPDDSQIKKSPDISKAGQVFAALVDCVAVMERDLNGLALIQQELKQAKQAIDQYELVDAEFKEWDGKGIPPAGTACELRMVPHGEWGAAMICFSSDNVIVWDWAEEPAANGKCTSYTHQVDARPVRGPEQIEAEEREKAVKELFFTINWQASEAEWDAISNDRKCDYAKAIDAGYRKQVAP